MITSQDTVWSVQGRGVQTNKHLNPLISCLLGKHIKPCVDTVELCSGHFQWQSSQVLQSSVLIGWVGLGLLGLG